MAKMFRARILLGAADNFNLCYHSELFASAVDNCNFDGRGLRPTNKPAFTDGSLAKENLPRVKRKLRSCQTGRRRPRSRRTRSRLR